MKSALGCADMGMASCSFEARSESKGEIMDALSGHVQKYHPELVTGISDKQKSEMAAKMDQKIHRV